MRTIKVCASLAVCALVLGQLNGQNAAPSTQGALKFQGLILIDDWNKIDEKNPREDVKGLAIEGLPFLNSQSASLNAAVAPYIGKEIGNGRWITNLISEVIAASRRAGHPVVDVFIPVRKSEDSPRININSGRFYLVVLDGKVGQVDTTIKRHYLWHREDVEVPDDKAQRARKRYASALGLNPGASIESSKVDQGLAKLNSNTDVRTANVSIKAGKEAGSADVKLEVHDQFPFRPFVGYDTEGNTFIGRSRVFGGFSYNDIATLGDRLAYQFTSDTDFTRYLGHALSYDLPFGHGNHLTVFGGYADFNVNLSQISPGLESLTQNGQNWIGGVRLSRDLPSYKFDGFFQSYRQQVFVGIDYKDIQSSLQFSASTLKNSTTETTDVPASEFTIAQAVGGYRGLLTDKLGSSSFILQVVGAPGGIIGHSSDKDYQNTRADASADYIYGKVSFDRDTPLFHMPLFWDVHVDYQYSGSELMPSEQFALGGAGTIRGFEQGVILSDKALVVRNELGFEIPQLNERLLKWGDHPGSLRFVGFFDYGRSDALGTAGGGTFTMGSFGAGVRMRWAKQVEATVDYGIQMIGKDAERRGGANADDVSSMLHAYIQISF